MISQLTSISIPIFYTIFFSCKSTKKEQVCPSSLIFSSIALPENHTLDKILFYLKSSFYVRIRPLFNLIICPKFKKEGVAGRKYISQIKENKSIVRMFSVSGLYKVIPPNQNCLEFSAPKSEQSVISRNSQLFPIVEY